MQDLSVELKNQVDRALTILKQGGIVAYPTDTVYGLGADYANPAAVQRVFAAKNRPLHLALPLLLSGEEQLRQVAAEIPESAACLITTFWPGALTLVVRKSGTVLDIVTANEKTVAVRVPAHLVPLALALGLGRPIIGTSANLHGWLSPVTAAEVRAQLGSTVDFIVDGGRCPGGIESTIIDVTPSRPVVIREGAITRAEINGVCELA